MTKLQIISKLWSAIYDMKLKQKPQKEIDRELDILEYECRKYADMDDEEVLKLNIKEVSEQSREALIFISNCAGATPEKA